MKVRYTRPALADLREILASIDLAYPRNGARMKQRIKAAIALVLHYPQIGSRTDDPAIRRMVAVPFPYLIFYEGKASHVVIHAIRHGARDPAGMPGSPPAT